MRLINADALMDEMFDRYCKECAKRKGIKNGKYRIIYEVGDAPCRACEIDDMKSELEEAPTIEPKHGKWEHRIGIGNVALMKCGECGFTYPELLGMTIFNFCPNCGASMERSE